MGNVKLKISKVGSSTIVESFDVDESKVLSKIVFNNRVDYLQTGVDRLVIPDIKSGGSITLKHADLFDNFGTANMDEFVTHLATNNFFSGTSAGAQQPVVSGEKISFLKDATYTQGSPLTLSSLGVVDVNLMNSLSTVKQIGDSSFNGANKINGLTEGSLYQIALKYKTDNAQGVSTFFTSLRNATTKEVVSEGTNSTSKVDPRTVLESTFVFLCDSLSAAQGVELNLNKHRGVSTNVVYDFEYIIKEFS